VPCFAACEWIRTYKSA